MGCLKPGEFGDDGTATSSGATNIARDKILGSIDKVFLYGDPRGDANADWVKTPSGNIIPNPDIYGHGE